MNMKYRNKIRLYAVMMVAVSSLFACERKPEAVITDGEDITEPSVVYETMAESTADKFGLNDLRTGQVTYLMNEADVKRILGEPEKIATSENRENANNEKDKGDNSDNQDKTLNVVNAGEKVYIYAGRTLIFADIDGEYRLTAFSSTSTEDVFSRGIKVGDTFDTVINAYYRDANCMNTGYYAQDNTTALGKYLYGNYSIENLEAVKSAGKIEYAVINFNGSYSLEEADSYILEYTYFEPPYIDVAATAMDDFGQLAFDMDENDKVTQIRWYYYPEVK